MSRLYLEKGGGGCYIDSHETSKGVCCGTYLESNSRESKRVGSTAAQLSRVKNGHEIGAEPGATRVLGPSRQACLSWSIPAAGLIGNT